VLGKKVNYFALSFIAPLSAKHDQITHSFSRICPKPLIVP
jgi:hypothetical protein